MRSLLLSLLLCTPLTLLADVEMHFDDGSKGLVSDGRVLFGDDEASVLFEVGQEYFTLINWDENTYMRVSPGFAADMMTQANAQMEQMLATMPPEQRAMMEAQMKGHLPQLQTRRTTSVRKTGNSDEVAGFDCEEAKIVYDDDESVQSVVCIASADELGISKSDFRALTAAMRSLAEMAQIGQEDTTEFDFEKLGGIPIRTTDQESDEDSEIVSINTSSVDSSRLQIPDNFREQSLEKMMQR